MNRQYEVRDLWAKRPKRMTFVDVPALAVDSRDRVYVVTRGACPVMVFDRKGELEQTWDRASFAFAHGICLAPDEQVYCVDADAHVVGKYTPDGQLLMTLGTPNEPSETGYMSNDYRTIVRPGRPFNRPTDVAVAASGEVYVSDGYGNACVHRFSPNGQLISSWGEPGRQPGQFNIPHGIVIDQQNRVLVADRENNRIQVFTSEGKLMAVWNGLYRPNSLCLGIDGTLCVAELTHRISFWSLDGQLLDRWGDEGMGLEAGSFVSPHAIAVDSHGDMYVGEVSESAARIDRGSRTLQKFTRRDA